MKAPQIRRCWNHECKSLSKLPGLLAVKSETHGSDHFQVVHDYCGLCGPLADTPDEAVRHWNALCCPGEWVRVPKEPTEAMLKILGGTGPGQRYEGDIFNIRRNATYVALLAVAQEILHVDK